MSNGRRSESGRTLRIAKSRWRIGGTRLHQLDGSSFLCVACRLPKVWWREKLRLPQYHWFALGL